MSKAFTKETDSNDNDSPELNEPKVPAGTKNYITPQGAERLKTEIKHLLDVVRPEVVNTVSWAAKNGDRSENGDYIYGKRRLREIDRRLRFLTKRLEIAEIVNPLDVKSDRVRFGASVNVRDEEGVEKSFSIVGIDETNVKIGLISWISPLGRALINAKVGDSVTFRTPSGEVEMEVLKIEYRAI